MRLRPLVCRTSVLLSELRGYEVDNTIVARIRLVSKLPLDYAMRLCVRHHQNPQGFRRLDGVQLGLFARGFRVQAG